MKVRSVRKPWARFQTSICGLLLKTSTFVPFHYIKEVASGNTAVLEFEQTLDGKYINGIDMITCDDEGKIVEFKVMVRPLQAINLLHKKMAAMLEQMKGE